MKPEDVSMKPEDAKTFTGYLTNPPMRKYRCGKGHEFEQPEGSVTFTWKGWGDTPSVSTKRPTCMACLLEWVDANFGADPAP